MATEAKDISAQDLQQEVKQDLQVPSLENSINTLVKSGGFDFLEAVVDGADNMNPIRKAKRSIFLNDPSKKPQRADLRKKLQMWIDLLTESNAVSEMIDKSTERAEVTEKLLKTNLKK